MPRGGFREGAGRPKGSGSGSTVEIKSVSLPPRVWALIDRARGEASRGVFLTACVYRAHNGHQSKAAIESALMSRLPSGLDAR